MGKKAYKTERSLLEEEKGSITGLLVRAKHIMSYMLEFHPSDEISYNLASVYYTSILLYKTEVDKILQSPDNTIIITEIAMSKINQYKNKIMLYQNEISLDPRYNLTVH
jgi:hypothetical protein